MLTRLRFKNWRSLREETIELSPITVFIGANSSGKTNIVDGLHFLRDAMSRGLDEAVNVRAYPDQIRSIGVHPDESIDLELSFISLNYGPLSYKLSTYYSNGKVSSEELLTGADDKMWLKAKGNEAEVKTEKDYPFPSVVATMVPVVAAIGRTDLFPQSQAVFQFITERWQLLDENFMPLRSIVSGTGGNPFVIDRCAENLSVILDYIYKHNRSLYDRLQDDLRWLLTQVSGLEMERTDVETRILIHETVLGNREAPTISAGTSRLLAMLTAFHVLDLRYAEMPGLVVIEEPDTALNPGILRNFVEQLRYFTTDEHPRQVILTTHNPAFLDHFEPEEIRVVTRDENGYTNVHPIPPHVKDIWLDEYTLGEVWRTNSFGGLS